MTSLTDRVKTFFTDDGWPIEEQDGLLTTAFQGDGDPFGCVVQVDEQRRAILVYAVSPFDAPPDRRDAAAEFVARAGYGMITSAFELGLDDGGVRVKGVVDLAQVPDDSLSTLVFTGLLRQVAYSVVVTLDRYLPWLRECVLNGMTAAEAVAKAEA